MHWGIAAAHAGRPDASRTSRGMAQCTECCKEGPHGISSGDRGAKLPASHPVPGMHSTNNPMIMRIQDAVSQGKQARHKKPPQGSSRSSWGMPSTSEMQQARTIFQSIMRRSASCASCASSAGCTRPSPWKNSSACSSASGVGGARPAWTLCRNQKQRYVRNLSPMG